MYNARMLPTNEQRCTLREVARWFRVSEKTVQRWRKRGLQVEGPPLRTTREEVQRFLAGSQPKPPRRVRRNLITESRVAAYYGPGKKTERGNAKRENGPGSASGRQSAAQKAIGLQV